MTIAQALAWASAGQQLLMYGLATEQQIAAMIRARHQDMSEAELNTILDNIRTGATAHKALAEADAADPTSAPA